MNFKNHILRSTALVMHELFHTLGILHHHERVDRDKYINVNFNNIQVEQVNKSRCELCRFDLRYDRTW